MARNFRNIASSIVRLQRRIKTKYGFDETRLRQKAIRSVANFELLCAGSAAHLDTAASIHVNFDYSQSGTHQDDDTTPITQTSDQGIPAHCQTVDAVAGNRVCITTTILGPKDHSGAIIASINIEEIDPAAIFRHSDQIRAIKRVHTANKVSLLPLVVLIAKKRRFHST